MEAEGTIETHSDQRRISTDRILIVKLSSIGDVIHALPIVQSIKQQVPKSHIGWVVKRRCADLLRGNPSIDSLYVIPDSPGVAELIELGTALRKDRYEIALDMQGLFISGVVTRLSGASRRIGLDRNREGNAIFLTEPSIPGRDRSRHALEILNGFTEALGLDPAVLTQPMSYLAEAETAYAKDVLSAIPGPRIALNVGASSVYKRWPMDHWVEAATALTDQGFGLVLLAGNSEAADADALQRAIPESRRVVNLGGKTSLKQLGSVLARCDALVTGDTGPMHLAAAVGTRTVALFGPTHPARTGPYGPGHTVIWKEIACSPCYRHPTCQGRVDCLRLITPQEVVAAVADLVPSIAPATRGSSE